MVSRIPILRRRPCYWRSQILYDALPRFGFAPALHLGARLDKENPSTHLWVTLSGRVLVDPPANCGSFVELAAYQSVSHD